MMLTPPHRWPEKTDALGVKVDRNKAHAVDLSRVQVGGQGRGIDPRRADQFKGCVGAAADGDVRAFDHADAGIESRFGQAAHVRRWIDPHSPVESNQSPRIQPCMGTTVNFAPMARSPLNIRASSPTVMPWRTGVCQ